MVVVCLVAALFYPLPCRVSAPVFIEPADAKSLHATSSGRLESHLSPGRNVAAGDVVVGLSHPGIEREWARSEAGVVRAQAHLLAIERRQIVDPQVGMQKSAAEESLRDLQDRFTQVQRERERLTLKATQAGVYWPAADQVRDHGRGRLPKWSGSLHDGQNEGCWIEAGTSLGLIGAADQYEAVAYLPQRDVNVLRTGQVVRVVLDAAAGSVLTGQLSELAVAETPSLDPLVALRLGIPTAATSQGHQFVGTWYRARIALESGAIPPVRRLGGTASIVVAPKSLWQRTVDWLWVTFPHL